jgi:tetratricopeptide (TPR) repeat protein
MRSLEPPESHFLNAAIGWLELGNTGEALSELCRLPIPARCHPDVFEVRWQIYARERKWETALDLARVIIKLDPQRPEGWIHQSYSLHELERTDEARRHLVEVAERFPEVSTIPYNLACYACQLGDLDETRDWLHRAIRVGDKRQIKSMALEDADLRPLWDEIRKL